MKEIFLEQKI